MAGAGTVPETIMEAVEDCTPTLVKNNLSFANDMNIPQNKRHSTSLSVMLEERFVEKEIITA